MGLFSGLGGILGGAVGSIFPGVGTVIGAGIGSAIGGGIDDNRANKKAEGYYNNNMDFAQKQFQFQQDYIKNSAQWRVEDAKKAGLHPMAALGMSTPSFSPISAPSAPEYASSNSVDPMEFGQNLNYAATKAKTAQQQQQMADLTLKGMQLDNEYKQAQIDLIKVDALASSIASNQAVNSPPSPKVNLQEPTGLPTEPQFFNAIDWATNGDYHVPMLSEAVADRTDDDPYFKRAVQLGSLVEFVDQHPGMYPPWKSLSDSERRKLISGHFHWVIHPFGFRLEPIPGHEKIVGSYSSDRTSYKGKIF